MAQERGGRFRAWDSSSFARTSLGVPAVGLRSNTITREQGVKVARHAREVGGETVTLLLDCDEEGEKGMRQALWVLAQLVPVRLGWTSEILGEKFKRREPESLSGTEWLKF